MKRTSNKANEMSLQVKNHYVSLLRRPRQEAARRIFHCKSFHLRVDITGGQPHKLAACSNYCRIRSKENDERILVDRSKNQSENSSVCNDFTNFVQVDRSQHRAPDFYKPSLPGFLWQNPFVQMEMPRSQQSRRVSQPLVPVHTQKNCRVCAWTSCPQRFCRCEQSRYRFDRARSKYGLSIRCLPHEETCSEMFKSAEFFAGENKTPSTQAFYRYKNARKKSQRIFLFSEKHSHRKETTGFQNFSFFGHRTNHPHHRLVRKTQTTETLSTLEYPSFCRTDCFPCAKIFTRCCLFHKKPHAKERENLVISLFHGCLYKKRQGWKRKRVWSNLSTGQNRWKFYCSLRQQFDTYGRQKELNCYRRRTRKDIWQRGIEKYCYRQRILFKPKHQEYCQERHCNMWDTASTSYQKSIQIGKHDPPTPSQSRYRTFDRACKELWVEKKQNEIRQSVFIAGISFCPWIQFASTDEAFSKDCVSYTVKLLYRKYLWGIPSSLCSSGHVAVAKYTSPKGSVISRQRLNSYSFVKDDPRL